MPPYEPLMTWSAATRSCSLKVNFANYAFLFDDALYSQCLS